MYNARGTIPVHHERPNNPHEPSSIEQNQSQTPEPLRNSSHHQEISAHGLLGQQVSKQKFNREWSESTTI